MRKYDLCFTTVDREQCANDFDSRGIAWELRATLDASRPTTTMTQSAWMTRPPGRDGALTGASQTSFLVDRAMCMVAMV
jgi:hypothetical protein